MSSKSLVAQAVADMNRATSELAFALADYEPQYARVFQSHIANGLKRLRDAESALVEASVHAQNEGAAFHTSTASG